MLVTLQETGGGGAQWTLKFIGLGPFQGSDQTLTYNSPATATSDESAGRFRRGLQGRPRALCRDDADRRSGSGSRSRRLEGEDAAPRRRTAGTTGSTGSACNGDVNGEESSSGRSIRGSFNANRTTDAWRMSFNTSANYRDSEFMIHDEEDGSDDDDPERQPESRASGTVVKSLTQHWSLGFLGSANSQTFRNFIVKTRLASGLEYNIFPYSESTRRMLTFQYTVGHDYHRYRENHDLRQAPGAAPRPSRRGRAQPAAALGQRERQHVSSRNT